MRVADVTYTVALGSQETCLFGDKSGLLIRGAKCIGRVGSNGYLVRDRYCKQVYLVPAAYMAPDPKDYAHEPLSRSHGGPDFAYDIDEELSVIHGARVEHHVLVGNKRWYVLRLPPPHWREGDRNQWWNGYEVRSSLNAYPRV